MSKKLHPRTLAPRYYCCIEGCGVWGYGGGAYIAEIVGGVYLCHRHYWILHPGIGKILSSYVKIGNKTELVKQLNLSLEVKIEHNRTS